MNRTRRNIVLTLLLASEASRQLKQLQAEPGYTTGQYPSHPKTNRKEKASNKTTTTAAATNKHKYELCYGDVCVVSVKRKKKKRKEKRS
jgi:hypothetical protein